MDKNRLFKDTLDMLHSLISLSSSSTRVRAEVVWVEKTESEGEFINTILVPELKIKIEHTNV